MSNRHIKERVWKRDGLKCRYCGAQLLMPPRGVPTHDQRYATVDHVVPRSSGGGLSARNLVTACQPCNRDKAAQPAMDYNLSRWGVS